MTYEIFLKDLGIKLKQQRKKLGLKQSELIEKINNGLEKMMMTTCQINNCRELNVAKVQQD